MSPMHRPIHRPMHPEARALIDAAKRREAPLCRESRQRVHGAVLRRAAALAGIGLASSTTLTAGAKAALSAAFTGPLLSMGVVMALGGAAVFAAHSAWTAPAAMSPAAMRRQETAATVASVIDPRRRPVSHPSSHASEPPAAVVVSAPPVLASSLTYPAPERHAFAPVVAAHPHDETIPSRTRPFALAPSPTPLTPPAEGAGTEAPECSRGPASNDTSALAASIASIDRTAQAAHLATTLDLLHRVHSALRARQPTQALAWLDADRSLLEGPLAEEVQAARVSALCQSGRGAEARTAMDRFLSVWPRSPLGPRLREGCVALAEIGIAPSQ